jgi:hypothetical protein
MEFKSFLANQAIRYVEDNKAEYAPQSPVPFIRRFEELYGFAQVPRTLAELDFKAGVTFLRGYFKGKIIDKLQIYENGMLCEARESNALCDEFLGEIFDWLPKIIDRPVKQKNTKAYISQMEVTTSVDMMTVFNKLSDVGRLIAVLLESYGQESDAYIASGFKMHYDTLGKPFPRGLEFVFERRANEPFDKNVYFTSAPLRTDDHLKVLAAIETAFS